MGRYLAALSINRYMLCIGHWQNATYISYGFLYIDVHAFSFVSSSRDLDVTVSHDLKPSTHIRQIVTKAHQRANAVLYRETLTYFCVLSLCTFYHLLKYYSVASPQGKQDVESIERVSQRRYTKRLGLPGLKMYSYESRLQRLNVTTLELRRIDLICATRLFLDLLM